MALPIRTRLTLAATGLVAAVLLAAGVFVYVRLEHDLLATVDVGLRSRVDAYLSAPGAPQLSSGTLAEADDAFAQILSPDGSVVDSTGGLTGAAVGQATPGYRTTTVRTTEERFPARLLLVRLDDGRVLVVGASLDDQREALGHLITVLLVGGPATLALVVLVIWLVVGAILRPVEAMRSEAAAISASEPGRRLPVPDTDDELSRLGRTLNEMLGRLQTALERERRFVDDASHELRTPLANLQAELDLALRRSRTVDELEVALRSASEETERLARLAEDLLVLARATEGRLPTRREDVDVATLVREVVRAFASRAAERGVLLDERADGSTTSRIDPLRLRQALGNLLDNAIRHTPRDGRVTVTLGRRDGAVVLSVTDTGPGFSDAFLAHPFEPFGRDDAPRGRPDGPGLGLAIVRAVAEAHGGSVEARNRAGGGAEVVLRLPA